MISVNAPASQTVPRIWVLVKAKVISLVQVADMLAIQFSDDIAKK